MNRDLQEKLEQLATCSAWMFDEALQLLTGKTSAQIDYLASNTHPPVPNIRCVLMLKTCEIEWPRKEGQGGGHIIYPKGKICSIDKDKAKYFIKKGWAKDTETPAIRKKRLADEKNKYQEIQGQFQLLNKFKRAVQDREIELLNDVETLPPEQWRLKGQSFVNWVHSHKETVSQLRHFPSNVDDILVNELLLLFQESKAEPALRSQTAKKENKQEEPEGQGGNHNKGGRPPADPDGKIYYKITELKDRGIQANKIPHNQELLKLIAKMNNQKNEYMGIETKTSKEDYKKCCGMALSTVKSITRKVFNK